MIIITIIWLFLIPIIFPVLSQDIITISPQPTATPDYSKIKINEIFPNPDGGGEWVELFNSGSVELYLDSWYIRDNTQSNKIAIETYTLSPQSFYVVEFNKDILNNSSPDSVILFDQNNRQIDQVSYQSTIKAMSLSDYQNNWCFTLPSPNQKNYSCYAPTYPPSPSSSPTNTPLPTPTAISLPSSTPTLQSPTLTLSPTKTPTLPLGKPTDTITPSLTTTSNILSTHFDSSLDNNNLLVSQDFGLVKGDSTQNEASASFDKMAWFPLILIFVGVFLLLIPLLVSKLKHDPSSS